MAPTTFEQAYEKVKQLVHDFQQGQARYMRTDYKEHEVRVDFIDPFFEALGWDVSHKYQRDPFRQEVKAEKTEIEGRVDYSFFLAPDFKNPVFFVEAKKPSVDIRNVQHYYQTIKYSWNAGLPVSILTDFQQLHILDCRNKAKPDDSAFAGDHRQYVFTDYLHKDKFAEIYYTFSREAVELGNIEKYVEKLRKPKGKAIQTGLFKGGYRPIEDDFLAYIDELRETLAKALKKNNEALESEELTEATQRIIDRLVFIRFLEDKQILDSYLVSEFGAKGDTWRDFVNACLALNAEYNGVVFKKHFIDGKGFEGPDDKMFRDACRDICHLNSPYNFRYIPIHILGSIYEQFLGKVVHATDKRVRIEEKPEVRKAGGVYYTPKYIVEYIVDNTIGKLIEDKNPKEIAQLHFADIACGSGSFLISVYEHLLDYHTVYYNRHENIVQAQKDGCRKDPEGVWQLSIRQKQSILTNNVYGVDIDAQAVEVTQLSLYLKLLENENAYTVANHLQSQGKGALFGADKILPDLSRNIQCGNSLIGSDILHGQLFADDELKKLNPFDYADAFPHIFKHKKVTKAHIFKPDMGIDEVQTVKEPVILYGEKQLKGGFDAIVGNPPYYLVESDKEKNYLKNKFHTLHFKINLYTCFSEHAINLVDSNGYLGYIIPNLLFANDSLSKLRSKMLRETVIEQLLNCGDGVFYKVAMPTMIFILQKSKHTNNKILVSAKADVSNNVLNAFKVLQSDFLSNHNYVFETADSRVKLLLKKLSEETEILEKVLDVNQGIITGNDKKYLSDKPINTKWKPTIRGKDMHRYSIEYPELFVYYNKDVLACPRTEDLFNVSEKLLLRRTGDRPVAVIDYNSAYNLHTLYSCRNKSEYCILYLLGLLNSKLFQFVYQAKMGTEVERTFAEIKIVYIRQLPIKVLNLTDKTDKAAHDHIVALVEQMLEGKKKLSEAVTDKDKEFYTRKCTMLDAQIDEGVFELYGLTEEEKQIVLNS